MSASINIYKESYCLNQYSSDGSFDDPIFEFPPTYFLGDTGQTRDLQTWVKNDGDYKFLTDVDTVFQLIPFDIADSDEKSWLKLALTEGGLDSAVAGNPLNMPDMDPDDVVSVWIRLHVPGSTSEVDKRDLRIRVVGNILPI